MDVTALADAQPARTAIIGLVLRSNYTMEQPNQGTEIEHRAATFKLSEEHPVNPFARSPHYAETREIFKGNNGGGQFQEMGYRRHAATLLEAYCASINDLAPIQYFNQLPTEFGRTKFINERNAIVDTLAMVAHAYVDRSLKLHFKEPGRPQGCL